MQTDLVYGYQANPDFFADEAANYLLSDQRRLALGDNNYDSACMVAAVFGLLDDEKRGALEAMILNYAPQWERRRRGVQGISQIPFLKGISFDLLSPAARRRLGELERCFPDYRFAPPPRLEARDVDPPPIAETAFARMSDEDWLNAMRKYKESYRPDRADFTGGLTGMSASLSTEAKKDPELFYRLSFRFDDSISFKYVQSLISALADTPHAKAEWVFDLIQRFANRISLDDRRGICLTLEKRSQENVPDELLDLLIEWALGDPDPTQETWQVKDRYGNNQHEGEPYNQGLNCNRGASVQAVSQCSLRREPPQTERVFTLLEKAAADPSTAVRSIVIECLDWTLYRGEDERTLQLFERAMKDHPRLLQSPPTHRFLHRCYRRYFPRIRTFIEQMLADTTHEQTRLSGAVIACLAAFDYSEAEDLVQQALAGDAVSRRGAAQVYARNLAHPDLSLEMRGLCRQRLASLLHDPDEGVRSSIGNCFGHLGESDFYPLRDFVRAYVHSPALEVSSRKLIEFLLNFVGYEQALLLEVAERYINTQESKQHEGGKWHIDRADHGDLTKLILSLYTHAPDSVAKARALELFERLLAAGSHYAHTALSDWDRR